MAPLISFQNVSKQYPDGGREILVLDRVSLSLDPGQAIGVYGGRRSGKSTLLRMAAGLVRPDSGSVCFEGEDMARMTTGERGRLLRGSIAFMAPDDWRAHPGESVLDHIATSLGSEGLTMREARRRAMQILDQVGVEGGDAGEPASGLSLTDRTRVQLARALAREPRVLVVDEPAQMPSLGDRERFFALLRTAVRERGMALLAASEKMSALQGVDVMMSIADGELCSSQGQGTVVNLPGRWRGTAGRSAG